MATRTRYKLKCGCRHEGEIVMVENDQPFSVSWEKYSLKNLNGQNFSIDRGYVDWDQVFSEMKPTCPECNASLSPKNFIS